MFFNLKSLDEKVVFSHTLNVKMKKCCLCRNIMCTLPVSVSVCVQKPHKEKRPVCQSDRTDPDLVLMSLQ